MPTLVKVHNNPSWRGRVPSSYITKPHRMHTDVARSVVCVWVLVRQVSCAKKAELLDWINVWADDSRGSKVPRIGWGSRSPTERCSTAHLKAFWVCCGVCSKRNHQFPSVFWQCWLDDGNGPPYGSVENLHLSSPNGLFQNTCWRQASMQLTSNPDHLYKTKVKLCVCARGTFEHHYTEKGEGCVKESGKCWNISTSSTDPQNTIAQQRVVPRWGCAALSSGSTWPQREASLSSRDLLPPTPWTTHGTASLQDRQTVSAAAQL